jgi:AAA domain
MGTAVTDTGNDPAAQEPLPSEGAKISSDPEALPAAEKAIDSEINEAAREAADEPLPAPPPLHPLAAAIVPIRDDASIRETARHIGPNDPLDPIILYEGKILDRWELYLACLLANRAPRFETYTGDDPVGFLIDRLRNRGCPNESQRAMLAARVCELPVGGNQYSEGMSIGRASDLLNVSPESISRAKKVLARGIPELIKAVDDGTLKVWKAYTIAKKQPQQQREELGLAADLPFGRTSATELHNPPELGSGDTAQFQGEPAVADADGAVGPELPETARGEDQSHAASTSTAAPGAPSGASAASAESSPRAPYYSSDEWIWPGYIPTPGVTAIVGGIKAATTLVAIKVAATVASGGAWPDRTCAASGEVAWLTAQHGSTTTMALRDRLAAAGATFEIAGYESVHIVEPELDGCLPIHHFRRDLQRLEPELSGTHK